MLQQVFDEKGNKVMKEDGTPETERVEREYLSFRPVYVFDVKQTTGEPLPSLVKIMQWCEKNITAHHSL